MSKAAAFQVVADFEAALAEYTGAPHVVTVDSCTNAIFLSLLWWRRGAGMQVGLPSRTYVGVAQAAKNAGASIVWDKQPWSGAYQIMGTYIWDAAKRLTSLMFLDLGIRTARYWPEAHGNVTLACVSFQAGKHLPVGRGGAILTDSAEAASWLRRARFDGRTPGDDTAPIQAPGYHMYLTPPDAARGLWLLSWLPKDNADLPSDEYDDLSTMECFR